MPKKETLPIFPLPEVVLFPGMNLPLHIFEEQYKTMIKKCLETDKQFGVVLEKEERCADVGTVALIVDVEKLEDGEMNILTEGKNRFQILSLLSESPYFVANIEKYEDIKYEIDTPLKKIIKEIKKLSNKALNISDLVSDEELAKKVKLPEDPDELLFLVAGNLTCSYEEKQSILETTSIKKRADNVLTLLKDEIQRLEILLENKKTKNEVVKNGKLKI